MMIDTEKAARTIQRIIDPLIRGDYAAVETLTAGRTLSANEIEHAIAEYGRRVVPPPPNSAPRSVVETEASNPVRWSVYVDLWTVEEGRSDLTLELTLTESSRDTYDVQIDNIHVL
jgi:hypothetical protein